MNTSDIETVSDTLQLDLFVGANDANQWWLGNVEISFAVPSAGIWYSGGGSADILSLNKEAWNTISLSVPQDIQDALNGDYSDFEITIGFNTAVGADPYLIDNLRFK